MSDQDNPWISASSAPHRKHPLCLWSLLLPTCMSSPAVPMSRHWRHWWASRTQRFHIDLETNSGIFCPSSREDICREDFPFPVSVKKTFIIKQTLSFLSQNELLDPNHSSLKSDNQPSLLFGLLGTTLPSGLGPTSSEDHTEFKKWVKSPSCNWCTSVIYAWSSLLFSLVIEELLLFTAFLFYLLE